MSAFEEGWVLMDRDSGAVYSRLEDRICKRTQRWLGRMGHLRSSDTRSFAFRPNHILVCTEVG